MRIEKCIGFLFCLTIMIVFAANAQASLIAYYSFEGNANDVSGNGKNGIVYNATLTSGHNGGQAYYFNYVDGTNDYIKVPLNINPAVYPYLTMGAWVKAEGNGNKVGGKVISDDDGGFDRTIGLDSRAGISPVNHWGAFTGKGVLAGPAYNVTGWDFIAVVYQPGKTTLYVNGTSYTANSAPGASKYDYTYIGSNPGFDEFFKGTIDDIFFFDEALSKSELDGLMASNHPVPLPAPLLLLGSGISAIIGFERKLRNGMYTSSVEMSAGQLETQTDLH